MIAAPKLTSYLIFSLLNFNMIKDFNYYSGLFPFRLLTLRQSLFIVLSFINIQSFTLVSKRKAPFQNK